MTEEIIFYTNPHIAWAYGSLDVGWGLQFGSIDVRPGFAEYWERVSDRDAYRRANALDDALMPAGRE